uniref:Putative secreted protein n=1 Tax=Ixodes ricinus TaxID=34613 RepID=A0A6B0TU72_IXORI
MRDSVLACVAASLPPCTSRAAIGTATSSPHTTNTPTETDERPPTHGSRTPAHVHVNQASRRRRLRDRRAKPHARRK